MNPLILTGNALAEHAGLLADESRLAGQALGLARPADERELAAILADCHAEGVPVALGSGLTGITGGAVPCGAVAINFGRMNHITGLFRRGDVWHVRCEPGVLLSQLRTALASGQFDDAAGWDASSRAALEGLRGSGTFIFPVDPTETSAAIGGMTACNASGARSFHFGPMRQHVMGVRGVLMDGRAFSLERGAVLADDAGRFALPLLDGTVLEGTAPAYAMPATKNAAGYWSLPGMDLVDLLIGSEGTLCAFSEITLRLWPEPEHTAGAMVFCPDEAMALALVRDLRGDGEERTVPRPLSLEFFDARSLDLLRASFAESDNPALRPTLPPHFDTALAVEFAGTRGAVETALDALDALLRKTGLADDATWLALDPQEHARLKDFRHRVPETVNRRVAEIKRRAPGVTKLGTDMAVPGAAFPDMLALYHTTLQEAGLDYVIFGHIGDHHVHVNILPRSEAEYARGKALYETFARAAVRAGGTISAEHGVGRLKTFLLPVMFGDDGVAAMRAVKRCFDPRNLLAPGVLLPPEAEPGLSRNAG